MTLPFQHAATLKYQMLKPNGYAEDALNKDGAKFRVIFGQQPRLDEFGDTIINSQVTYIKTLQSEVDRLQLKKRQLITVNGLAHTMLDIPPPSILGEVIIQIQET
jgi:hypothetical protein